MRFSIPTGHLADRPGRKPLIVSRMALGAAGVAGLVGLRVTAVLVGLLWLADGAALRFGVPAPDRV